MRRKLVWRSLFLALALVLTACTGSNSQSGSDGNQPAASGNADQQTSPPPAAATSRLDTVLANGKLVCGVNGALPGFSFVDTNGKYSGLDVDFCRAIAAALFDDPEKVEYRNLSTTDRFTAVQTGEVDVLIRNTTWTISRDSSVGMEFAPVVFYDGQGMMVRQDSGIQKLEDMNGMTVCVQTGTTTELNLADQMGKRGVRYTPQSFENIDATYAAYAEGQCDGVTSDRSQLMSRRSTMPNPEDHVILDVVMSKEPLAPAVANGDSRWFDVVKWVVYATIEAEELGIDSKNVGAMASSTDPSIKRFMGSAEGDLGVGLGLTNDFAARIIKHVGNYGEIYDRNLGPDTAFKLARGQNDLWTRGGLMYSPPIR